MTQSHVGHRSHTTSLERSHRDGPGHVGVPGKQTLTEALGAVQRKVHDEAASGAGGTTGSQAIQDAAARGIRGPARPLPHASTIQKLFGRHDISHVKAHDDAPAAGAANAIGAQAYAMGDHVAFAGTPSLHTAAHEAAHVVQQRAGVHLAGGVGEAGDEHEKHADAVADRVVQGRSSEDLLDAYARPGTKQGGAAGPSAPVQGVFTTTKGFDGHQSAVEALDVIKKLLTDYTEDWAWAVKSKDVNVHFQLGNTGGAHGTTQLMLGDTNLSSMALLKPDQAIKRLQAPTPLDVLITIDKGSIVDADQRKSPLEPYVWLAHEIGAHVQPKLAFIRKAATTGKITQKDLAVMLHSETAEHEDIHHEKGARPKNETYYRLVLCLATQIPDKEVQKAFLEYYQADVERYEADKEEEDKDLDERSNDLIRYMAARRIQQERAKELCTNITFGLFIAMTLGALIAAVVYGSR